MWQPTQLQIDQSNLMNFMNKTGHRDYASLHKWSITDPEFWRTLWDFLNIKGEPGDITLSGDGTILGSTFFPNGTLNYAENVLAHMPEKAIIYWAENRHKQTYTRDEVIADVSRLIGWFSTQNIAPKTRIACLLTNRPESLVCLLATSKLGAIFSSCSPDFGVQGILDRFGQIEPQILITSPDYLYNGKIISIEAKILELADKLPTVTTILLVDQDAHGPISNQLRHHPKIKLWSNAIADRTAKPLVFQPFPFNHPLYILYSSGTTGAPKCIVHGAGNALIQHKKEHQLHCDIKPDDKLFYFTTMGWMMWNWLVTAPASGATLLLFDGSPFYPKGNLLFDFAEHTGMTHFGTSAKYIDALKKIGLKPEASHNLTALRMMMSTGSPLAPESFDYVEESIKKDMALCSISGGTDIVSCFVLGCPILPVHRGEIQVAGLGMDVDIISEDGDFLETGKGELVCKSPFPARPIEFWNDPQKTKFNAAYFDKFPPLWAHGDYAEHTDNNGYIIHGRSDAVLNPGGVRIGTAEIYRQVEQIPEVVESLAIGQNWNNDVRVILFVKLQPEIILDNQLVDRIKKQIKDNASPRHVPAKIIAVSDIPRTKSGKIVELTVRAIIHGEDVKNTESLANPEALEEYRNIKELSC